MALHGLGRVGGGSERSEYGWRGGWKGTIAAGRARGREEGSGRVLGEGREVNGREKEEVMMAMRCDGEEWDEGWKEVGRGSGVRGSEERC